MLPVIAAAFEFGRKKICHINASWADCPVPSHRLDDPF